MTSASSVRPSWPDARRLATEAGGALALTPQSLPLDECTGRTLARPLLAVTPIPHFDSAAMDGWAVSGDGPWLVEEAPSTEDVRPLEAGRARAIVTGALVPIGAEAVLRSESAELLDDRVRSTHPREPRPGHHIRRAGREAAAGDQLIDAGRRLNPAHIALAASAGVDALTVHALPTITLLTTGDEIVTSGAPTAGRVRDSFGVTLPALLDMLGGTVTSHHRLPDSPDAIVEAISSARSAMIVTTGGTGSSSADHVRGALHALDARFVVDGVAMRPGGPTCLAELPDGRLVLALPGNPLAALVASLTLGGPVLAAAGGRSLTPVGRVRTTRVEGRAGATLVVPYEMTEGRAVPTDWNGSAMMRGLAKACGLLVIPETGIDDGGSAETVALPWR